MSVRTRIITLLSGAGAATGLAAVTAAPAHAQAPVQVPGLLDPVSGLVQALLSLVSDREVKTDIAPVRWDR
ncbi:MULTISPECIES: hypothetical protein [Thermomonospora]|uniref:ABC transporter substrate-binding protein n=1 Tax=Thermomonospora cellulosilytica TaxID=1411118 RepID=A0A7W3N1N9_9ACTN|nr:MULTISPECIES: hypothetical protein [Thermomonospora]MBA9005842.1 hypothetical protein [Thermomonospora cellulosilytica]